MDSGPSNITQTSKTEFPSWAQGAATWGLNQAQNLAQTQRNPVVSTRPYDAGTNIAPGVRQQGWFDPSNFSYQQTRQGSILTGKEGNQFAVDAFGNRLNPAEQGVQVQFDPLGQQWRNGQISGWVDPTNQVRNGLLPNTFDPTATGTTVGQKLMGQGGVQFQTNDWGMKIDPRTGELNPNWQTDMFGNIFQDGIFTGAVDALGRVNPLLIQSQTGGSDTAQQPQGAPGVTAPPTAPLTNWSNNQYTQYGASGNILRPGKNGTIDTRNTAYVDADPNSNYAWSTSTSSWVPKSTLPTVFKGWKDKGGTAGTGSTGTQPAQSNYWNINPSGTVAPINAWQQQGLQMLLDRAQGGESTDPMVRAAEGALTDTLSGKYLNLDSNPMWEPYSQRIQEAYQYGVAPQMNAAYANAEAFGPYNSAWVQQQALDARNKLGDPLALLAGNIYQTERDWMNKAAGLVPSIQQAGYVPGQVVQGVGNFGQQQTQRYTDATMNAMLDNSNYPWSQLYNLASIGMPFAGQASVNTAPNPYQTSPIAGAIGGGLLGYGASTIPAIAGVAGAAAPWLYPLLGAGLGLAMS